MKFLVILSALTTLVTASFLRDEIIDSQDDDIISTDSDMAQQMILSKPWDWRSILAYKLGLQHMTPNILNNEELSGLNRMPWWTCKDSTCLHRRRHTRIPRMVDGTTSGSPNLHEMDKMSLMPRWMCADPTCLHHRMLERTPIMTNTLHWSPKTLEMYPRMNHMALPMMQTMHRSPMMPMFMKPSMVDESKTPMMRMDMTPIDMWHMGSSMRMTEDLPLSDMTMMNTGMQPETNFRTLYLNHMNTLQHQMNMPRMTNERYMTHTV